MKKTILILLLFFIQANAQVATIASTVPVKLEITGDCVLETGKMVTYLNTRSSVLDTATITYETADTIQCTVDIGRDTSYTVTVHAENATSSKRIKYSEKIRGSRVKAYFSVK